MWGVGEGAGELDVHDHLLVYVGVAHHGAELVEGDLAVLVAVGEQDGLVHDLLQLRVLEVVAHHHLEHLRRTRARVIAGSDVCLLSEAFEINIFS